MVIEKRKERRIKVNLPIRITHQDNLEVVGKTENISRLGSYVELDKEVPVGSDIDVTLEIPQYCPDLSLTGTVQCRGNIFRCNVTKETESQKYYGIGIFFTDFLKSSDRDKLSKYIDFLILNEDKSIREGIKRWQIKRDKAKITKQAREKKIGQKEFQTEALSLLKQILSRLE